jgi:two-component system phosphate regulon response regulator OmpR
VAADAPQARLHFAAMRFDLIVLDVMMPGESGVDLTRWVRTNDDVPILLLTAMGEAKDRVAGLESGADDYLAKPFEPRELLLRIASILRRGPHRAPPKGCRFGGFSFDPARGELRHGARIVHLTTAESTLLALLAAAPGTIHDRDDLASRAGGGMNPRTVDVQVTRLRRKIETDPRQPRFLQTVRGRGYVLWAD